MATRKPAQKKDKADKPRCGLCGKAGKLRKTECCGNWVCDDEHKYVLFSYASNSCSRNHRGKTLCGYHHTEDHAGDWKECQTCREGFEPEMIAWYGTNEYNFEKLPDPPSYEPTKCSECDAVINLGNDGYTKCANEYWCHACGSKRMQRAMLGL